MLNPFSFNTSQILVSHSFQLLLWLPPLSLNFSREMSLFTSHLFLNHPMWLWLSEFHLQGALLRGSVFVGHLSWTLSTFGSDDDILRLELLPAPSFPGAALSGCSSYFSCTALSYFWTCSLPPKIADVLSVWSQDSSQVTEVFLPAYSHQFHGSIQQLPTGIPIFISRPIFFSVS